MTVRLTGPLDLVLLAVHRLRQAFALVQLLGEPVPSEDGSVHLDVEVAL